MKEALEKALNEVAGYLELGMPTDAYETLDDLPEEFETGHVCVW